jgi:hypothetical protein
MFVLKRIPIPPTSNNLYASVRGRFIKSIEGRKYDAALKLYSIRNFKLIDTIKAELKPNDLLKIHCYFIFSKNRIISKKGDYKKLDVTNRIKALHDAVSDFIGIDDKQFISIMCEKIICENQDDEQVIVTLDKCDQLNIKDIKLGD